MTKVNKPLGAVLIGLGILPAILLSLLCVPSYLAATFGIVVSAAVITAVLALGIFAAIAFPFLAPFIATIIALAAQGLTPAAIAAL